MAPLLEGEGFLETAHGFWRENSETWTVVHFQRSSKSSRLEILFAVELGIASKLVCRFFDVPSERCQRIEACHWRQRLGTAAGRGDHWWSVKEGTKTAEIASDVGGLLHACGFPALAALSGDAALRDLWLSGTSPGLTRVQRLMNLLVILASLGPVSALASVEQELRHSACGSPVGHQVAWLLDRVGSEVG
jgi:hypothetical protein